MKIGRNDPCPCGSGIKYKKCCAGKEGAAPAGPGAVLDELKGMLEGQTFASLEEVNAFAARFMQSRNQAAIDDFHGLSSEQMHRLLYFPLETPQLVELPPCLDVVPEAPIMTLFNLLLDGVGADGLKATATGNLPRNFCRDAALAYMGEEKYAQWSRLGALRSEPDFGELHVTRLVAGLAGLIRKYKGKFIASKECRTIMAKQGAAGIYPRLLLAFARKYNWGYQDRYDEIPFIQQSFLFGLYLLTKYGSDWRSNTFYADCFVKAFPNLLLQVRPVGGYATPEEELGRCYSLRCLERFAQFLGLIEIDRDEKARYFGPFQVRKLPLLERAVRFHL